MKIILTRKESQIILEEYMDANYAIGDEKVEMKYPLSELGEEVTFEVIEPITDESFHNE